MTAALALELVAPLQSWGLQSRSSLRDTALAPTKSGIVGLMAAALGRRRDEPADDLAGLLLCVRIDQAGSVQADFQTIGVGYRSDPVWPQAVWTGGGALKGGDRSLMTSERFYVADGAFLAVLEGDAETLEACAGAIRSPVFQLALGRRSCPPGQPICRCEPADVTARAVLERYPRLTRSTGALMAIEELPPSEAYRAAEFLPDQPVGPPWARRFGPRPIRHSAVNPPNHVSVAA